MRVELDLPDDLAEALERFRSSEPLEPTTVETVILLLREQLTTLGLLEAYEPPEDPGELH